MTPEQMELLDYCSVRGIDVGQLRAVANLMLGVPDDIRISALPRVLACNSSLLPVAHPYDPPSDMGDLGTAAHDGLAQMVMGAIPDIEAIATQHSVDPDELDRLIYYGTMAWHDLKLDPQHCRVEVPLQGRGIRGHADVAYHDGCASVIVDWKTNRVKRSYRAQLAGYAAALLHEFIPPESGCVKVVIIWLRFGEYETATIGQAEVNSLYDDLETARKKAGSRYAPGDACTYCPRQLVCEARHDYLHSAAAALIPLKEVSITPKILPELYSSAKALERALKHYDKALRILLHEGPAQDSAGNVYEMGLTTKDKIVPELAWPVLIEAGLTDEQLASCVTLSKTKAMKLVGKDLKRGDKGRFRGQVYHDLEDAGAIKQTVSEGIKVRKEEDNG